MILRAGLVAGVMMVALALPASAQTTAASYDVPPISGASNAAVPVPTETPLAAPSSLQPSAVAQAGTGATQLEQIPAHAMSAGLKTVAGVVDSAMNSSTSIGVKIYIALTIISFSWAAMFWMMDGSNLSFVVKNVLTRTIETSLWIAVIQSTWKMPGGGEGWFKLILEAGANIGLTLAKAGHTANFSGTELTATFGGSSGVFQWDGNIDTLPGSFVSFGAALFNAIVASAEFGKGGIIGFLEGALNGHLMISLVTYVLAILSGIWAFCVMAYVAVRLWLSLMNIYMMAPMSFLQGLAGSRRLSGYAGSFLSGALIVGIEICLTVMMCGLMYTSITQETQYFSSIQDWLVTPPSASHPWGPCGIPGAGFLPVCGDAQTAVDVGTLVAIDTTLALYLWMLLNVPSRARALLEGRFTVSPQEVAGALSAAPVPGAKVAGYGMNVLNAGATKGFEGAASTAAAPFVNAGKELAKLGAIVGIGIATDGVGLAAMGEAGMAGFEAGGISGAGAGMLGKAIGSGMFKAGGKEAAETAAADGAEETASAEERAGETHGGGEAPNAPDAAADVGEQTQQRTVHVDTSYDETKSELPSSDGDAQDATISRTVSVDTELHEILRSLPNTIAAAVAGATSGGSGEQSGGGSAGGGGGSGGSQSAISQFFGDMSDDRSVGRSLLNKVANMKIERGEEPPMPIDEQSYSSFGPGAIRVGRGD